MKNGLLWTPIALALFGALAHAETVDRKTVTTYNASGLMETVDGPRTDVSDVTRYEYDTDGRLVTVTDALGHVTTFGNYDLYGNPGRSVDANGVVTTMTYTPEGWPETVVRDAEGMPSSMTLSYDAIGNIVQSKDADNVIIKYTFDDASRLTDISDGAGNRIHYTLDALGNRTKEETFDSVGELRRSLSRGFNSLGQLLIEVDGLNRTIVTFDPVDGYDAAGHPVHMRDAKGVQKKQSYDALNRLISSIEDYNGTEPATANVQSIYSFDLSNNLDGVSDPSGQNTTYERNGLGDLVGIHSPDTGVTAFTIDAAGNRLTRTDARGVVVTYSYDALNRITSEAYADGSLNISYRYDEPNDVTACAASSPIGRLTRIVEQAVVTTYCYDARGNVTQKRQSQGGLTAALGYTYTLADRVETETRPSGAIVRYGYDQLGQIQGVWLTPAGGTEQVLASSFTWLPFGPLRSYVLGNGQSVVKTFDANYRMTDLVSPALELHFKLDEMGNITSVSETDGGSAAYRYDPLYRLTSVDDPRGNAVEAYTYNKTGDRTSKSAPGILTGSYEYEPGTHWLKAVGPSARSYDANGNTTGSSGAGSTWGYGYNGRNRMTVVQQDGATVGSYLFNARDERIAKTVGGVTTLFIYDASSQLQEEASSSRSRDYISISGTPLAVVDTSESGVSIGFVTADGLGSPRVVASASGAVLWKWPYAMNPFGENGPMSQSGYVLNLRFPGQYADTEAGVNYNLHRDFDAAAGRYRQSDPIGLSGGISTYSYAMSNPLVQSDLLGLSVYVCRDPAFEGKLGPISHYWIKTDTIESGMGTPKAGANAGNRYDFVGSPVETVDHGPRSQGLNAECRLVPTANEATVNRLIAPGRPLGRFLPPVNYCHSFVRDVLDQANGEDPFNSKLPVPSPYMVDPYK